MAGDTVHRTSVVGDALRRARTAIVGVGVFSFFINLLMLTGPLYMLQVYDRVLLSRSVETLVGLSIVMAVLFGFMGGFDWIRARILARLADGLEADLGPETFSRWLRAGQSDAKLANLQPVNELSTLRTFFAGNAPSTFFDVPWVPIYIGVIFFLHPMLGWLAVFGTFVIFCSALYNEITTREPTKEALAVQRSERAFSLQAIRNADTIAALGMGPAVARRWRGINRDAGAKNIAATDRRASATSFTKGFRMFIQSAVLGLGGYYAIKGVITPGAMIAGSIIMGRAMAPVQQAISQWRGFLAARDAWGKLDEFYDKTTGETEHIQLPAPTGRMEVEGVTAGPPGASKAVLNNVTFSLQAGQGLGIVGPSASGKSTLARMLTGIWMPQRGAVRLDGATFDQYDAATLGDAVGYLPQNVELFDGTIEQNIARFREDATPEAIVAAAQMAGVHEMILKLPDGYATKVGMGGVVLSGGQVQRVALARAVYGSPVLVVLDEPNANLDEEGDVALARCIRTLRERGATVIVVAHRRSAIVHLDHLLVLGDGRVEAFGPKNDVIEQLAKARGDAAARRDAAKAGKRPSGSAQAARTAGGRGPVAGPAGAITGPAGG